MSAKRGWACHRERTVAIGIDGTARPHGGRIGTLLQQKRCELRAQKVARPSGHAASRCTIGIPGPNAQWCGPNPGSSGRLATDRLVGTMGPCEAVQSDLNYYNELRPDYSVVPC